MIDIKIGDQYRIGSDELQLVLYQKTEKSSLDSKSKTWRVIGYYANLEQLLHGLTERELRLSDAKSISELRKILEKLEHRYSSLLSGLNDNPRVG